MGILSQCLVVNILFCECDGDTPDLHVRTHSIPTRRYSDLPAMKAAEAIAFMGALRGLDWRTGRKRAREMLADAGLADAADEKIRKLSKGMAQLVQLLGSVVHRPELLVHDEPFSGLDPVNPEELE